jgi:hypothetical protein
MRWLIPIVCLAGCASTSRAPGAQVASVERVTEEAEVHGDTRALRAGDVVQFARRVCAPLNAKSVIVHCTSEPLERGEVVRVIDAGRALVRLDADFAVRAGDTWTPALQHASR